MSRKMDLMSVLILYIVIIHSADHDHFSRIQKTALSLSKKQRIDAVFDAIESQNSDRFQYLIGHYPRLLQAYDDTGKTPLLRLLKCDGHNNDFCQRNVLFVLEHGVDVNAPDRDNRWTPLLQVIYHKKLEEPLDLVQLLVGSGARVNEVKEKDTALMLAAFNGQKNIVRFLLKSGADATLKDREGKTAAQIAHSQGHVQLADYIEKYKPVKNKQQFK